MDRAVSPPCRRPRRDSLRPPHSPPSPPCPHSDPDPSCHILEDRRGGYQGSVISFTKEKETKDRQAVVSSASSSPLFPLSPPFSSFISYSPCYPTHRRVYCCIIPDGLIVIFLCFVRPPARFVRCVRYSAAPSTEFLGPWPSRPRG